MKKIFTYLAGVIMLLSSVLTIGFFTVPSPSHNINAEPVYINLPFDCFYLTTDLYRTTTTTTVSLGNGSKELDLPNTNSKADLQCYAIIGLKPADYTIQEGDYVDKTLDEVLTKNPYVRLPDYITLNGDIKGHIVGLSYYKKSDQLSKGYSQDCTYYNESSEVIFSQQTQSEDTETTVSANINKNRGAFTITTTFNQETDETTIDEYCSALKLIKGVQIPDSYRYIGDESFENSNVEEVQFATDNIGSKYFGDDVFKGCKSLEKCYVSENNHVLPSNLDNSTNIYSTSKTRVVPSNTFYNTKIQSAYIPNTFTEICKNAFDGCKNLTSVTFEPQADNAEEPNAKFTSIGDAAFSGCVLLSDITLPDTLTSIFPYAFYNTYSLKQFHIPASVITIQGQAFALDTSSNEEEYAKIITFDSPRTIIIDSRDKEITLATNSPFAITNNIIGQSASFISYNYVYYNKTDDDKVHKSLTNSLATGLAPEDDENGKENTTVLDKTAAIYIDHLPLKSTYTLQYVNANQSNIKKDNLFTEGLFGSKNEVSTEYDIGSKLQILDSGYAKGFKDKNGNIDPIDLDQYDFMGWSIVLKNGDNIISSITLDAKDKEDNPITISNQTPVFTDVEIIAHYQIKKYKITIVGDDDVEDCAYGLTYGKIFEDKWYCNGDLNPDKLGYVGLYTDSKYTTLIDFNDKVEGSKTFYLRTVDFADLYNFKEENGGYVITGLKSNVGPVSQLYFPATHNNKNIIGIADRAFINNTSLCRFYFADYDKDSDFTIGNMAFQGCTNLVYAEIPVSNVTVNNNAFYNCNTNLKIIILGSLKNETRSNYTGLNGYKSKLYMSYTDASDYDNACEDISFTLYVNGDVTKSYLKYSLFPHHFLHFPNKNEISVQGYYFIGWGYKTGSMTDYVGESEGVTSTYRQLINGSYNTSEGEEAITAKSDVYFNCAFKCKFDIKSNNTVYGWSDDYIKYANQEIANDSSLSLSSFFEVVDLPENVTSIKSNAFKVEDTPTAEEYNTYIKKIIINKNLSVINQAAFQRCTNLKEVIFPEDYTHFLDIGPYAFMECSALQSFGKISKDNYVKISSLAYVSAFEGCTSLRNMYMSNDSSLTSIGASCFKGCTNLQSIDIPYTVIYLYQNCFENCTSLSQVRFTDDSCLLQIRESAFANSGIQIINLDYTEVDEVFDNAFANTTKLSRLNLYNRNRYQVKLHRGLFSGSSITEVTLYKFSLANGISISDVFENAQNLQKIYLLGDQSEYHNYWISSAQDDSLISDGIVYTISGKYNVDDATSVDVLKIDFIPLGYTGTLVIPSCVISIDENDHNFDYLRNVTAIEMEGIFESTNRDYLVYDKDLYCINSGNVSLKFVPNYNISNGIYTLKSSFEVGDDMSYNVVELHSYALNSNTNIKVLKFEDNKNIGTLPSVISPSIEAIVIPKFIKTFSSVKNLSNLHTIKIEGTYIERGNIILAFNETNHAVIRNDYFGDTLPVFVVPTEDVDTYVSSFGYSHLIANNSLQVRSYLTVTYNTNDGVELSDTEFEFGSTPTLSSAEKFGHDFAGWYTDESLTTPYSPTVEYGDLTLYAKYNLHKYTYTYMVGDDTYYAEEVYYDTYPNGPKSEPTKTGKVFVGWTTEDGKEYSLSKNKASSDVVLYAVFKTDNKFIAKIAIIGVAGIVVLGFVITLIVKSVRRRKNKNN